MFCSKHSPLPFIFSVNQLENREKTEEKGPAQPSRTDLIQPKGANKSTKS
jgi:hypothetical protein